MCVQVISERTKPRLHQYQSEVFVIIGGCTKDERFVSEVTCLDPLRRSRLEVAKLPGTDTEAESDTRKWVEFACITFRNEVYLSGERTARGHRVSIKTHSMGINVMQTEERLTVCPTM